MNHEQLDSISSSRRHITQDLSTRRQPLVRPTRSPVLSVLFERKSASSSAFIDHAAADSSSKDKMRVRHKLLFVVAERNERNEKGSVMKGSRSTRILELFPRCLAADELSISQSERGWEVDIEL